MSNQMNDHMNIYAKELEKSFGFKSFRENQLDIIKTILEEHRDVCAVLFTGAGKSLCFQFPAVFLNKISIVISPLISLMNDQQMKLNKMGISACTLNSTVPNKNKIKRDIIDNLYKIVYVTPEYLVDQMDFLKDLYEMDLLALVCIDESHVVSTWSHDFRPTYKKLGCIKETIPNVCVMAVTATATKNVQKDIINILKLENPKIVKSTFDRPNLNMYVKQKNPNIATDLLKYVKENEPTIIYCQTRQMTEDIAKLLTKKGIPCKSYHAGMSTADRELTHETFATNEVSCISATIAFGMGIDIVIRTVIHYGIPKNMESYYQEIGRAGRDGKQSNCYLLYSLSDMATNNYFINQISDVNYRQRMIQIAQIMKNYVFSSTCRRKYVLNYFDEEYPKVNCESCDNCLNKKQINVKNFARYANLIFKTMNYTGNAFGALMLINILRGSKSKAIYDRFKRNEQIYGMGCNKTDQWWRMLIRILINNGYIDEKPLSGGRAFTLVISKKGSTWYTDYSKDDTKQLMLEVPSDMEPEKQTKEIKSFKINNDDDIDDEINLDDIDSLDDINKIIDKKVSKSTNKITHTDTLKLYNDGKSLKEIAKELNINERTIENHIIKLYKDGHDIDLTKIGFSNDVHNIIIQQINKYGTDKLKTIKENLPRKISYLHIKLSLIKMNNKNNDCDDDYNNDCDDDESIFEEYMFVNNNKQIVQHKNTIYNREYIDKLFNEHTFNNPFDAEYINIMSTFYQNVNSHK